MRPAAQLVLGAALVGAARAACTVSAACDAVQTCADCNYRGTCVGGVCECDTRRSGWANGACSSYETQSEAECTLPAFGSTWSEEADCTSWAGRAPLALRGVDEVSGEPTVELVDESGEPKVRFTLMKGSIGRMDLVISHDATSCPAVSVAGQVAFDPPPTVYGYWSTYTDEKKNEYRTALGCGPDETLADDRNVKLWGLQIVDQWGAPDVTWADLTGDATELGAQLDTPTHAHVMNDIAGNRVTFSSKSFAITFDGAAASSGVHTATLQVTAKDKYTGRDLQCTRDSSDGNYCEPKVAFTIPIVFEITEPNYFVLAVPSSLDIVTRAGEETLREFQLFNVLPGPVTYSIDCGALPAMISPEQAECDADPVGSIVGQIQPQGEALLTLTVVADSVARDEPYAHTLGITGTNENNVAVTLEVPFEVRVTAKLVPDLTQTQLVLPEIVTAGTALVASILPRDEYGNVINSVGLDFTMEVTLEAEAGQDAWAQTVHSRFVPPYPGHEHPYQAEAPYIPRKGTYAVTLSTTQGAVVNPDGGGAFQVDVLPLNCTGPGAEVDHGPHAHADEDGLECGCSPGYGMDAGMRCVPCSLTPAGSAHGNLHSANGICEACPSGKQPATNESACVWCDAGQASAEGKCSACDSGSIPVDEQSRCEVCEAGKEPSDDGALCVSCGAGWATSTGHCESCSVDGPGKIPVDNQARCQTCEGGKEPAANRSTCIQCEPGEAASEGACATCSAGYHTVDSQARCELCPRGRVTADNVACESCGAGKQPNSEDRPTVCDLCPDGKFKATDSGSCESCEVGKQPNVDRTMCEVCPQGYAGVQGECEKCAVGKLPDADQTVCEQCPPFSTTSAAGATECLCMNDYYDQDQGAVLNCTECPVGAVCQSGSRMYARAGFWVDTNGSSHVPIFSPRHCLPGNCLGYCHFDPDSVGCSGNHWEEVAEGSPPNQCRTGSTGPLCSECETVGDVEYVKVEGSCVPCGAFDWGSVVGSSAMYACVCLFFLHKSRRIVTGRDCDIHNSSALAAIAVFFIQTMVLLPTNFKLFESIAAAFIMTPDTATQDDGACISTGQFYKDWALKYLVPLLVAAFTALLCLISGIRKWQRKMALFFTLQFSLFPINMRSISLWFCRSDLDETCAEDDPSCDSRSFMRLDTAQECSGSDYRTAQVVGTILFAIFAVLLPVMLYRSMERSMESHAKLLKVQAYLKYGFVKGAEELKNKAWQDNHSAEFAARDFLSVIYYPLRRRTFWWAIIVIMRPTLIAFVYNSRNRANGVAFYFADWRILCVLILMIYNCLQATIRPFKHLNESQLDSFSMLLLMSLLVVSINTDFMLTSGADVEVLQTYVQPLATVFLLILVGLAAAATWYRTQNNIKSMIARNRWTMAWNSMGGSNSMSDPLSDIGRTVEEFEEDARKSKGVLAKISQIGIASAKLPIFEQIDVDESGQISLEEFLEWWKLRTIRAKCADDMAEVATQLFHKFDIDGSGEVDEREFDHIVVGLREWHADQKAMMAQYEEPLEQKQAAVAAEKARVVASMESLGWKHTRERGWVRPPPEERQLYARPRSPTKWAGTANPLAVPAKVAGSARHSMFEIETSTRGSRQVSFESSASEAASHAETMRRSSLQSVAVTHGGEVARRSSLQSVAAEMPTEPEQLADRIIEDLFYEIDADHSGEISFNEFADWWHDYGGDLEPTWEVAFRMIEERDGLPGVTLPQLREVMEAVATEGWQDAVDPQTGRAYYINPKTRESTWVEPSIGFVAAFMEAAGIKPSPQGFVSVPRKQPQRPPRVAPRPAAAVRKSKPQPAAVDNADSAVTDHRIPAAAQLVPAFTGEEQAADRHFAPEDFAEDPVIAEPEPEPQAAVAAKEEPQEQQEQAQEPEKSAGRRSATTLSGAVHESEMVEKLVGAVDPAATGEVLQMEWQGWWEKHHSISDSKVPVMELLKIGRTFTREFEAHDGTLSVRQLVDVLVECCASEWVEKFDGNGRRYYAKISTMTSQWVVTSEEIDAWLQDRVRFD